MEFLTFDLMALLFIIALVAGLIDTIAGGGGLLTIPALFYAGLPPSVALATNKLQGTMGSFTASFYFVRNNIVSLQEMKWMIVLTFIGAGLGTLLILQLDSSFLTKVIPYLLIGIGIYFLFSPNLNEIDKKKKISVMVYAFTFAFIIGFYDGFFGPATGSFFVISLLYFLGSNLIKATAQAKILNFTSNISALTFFIIFGEIYWEVGLLMALGQGIGAVIGSRLVLKNGVKIIKPLIVVVSFLMSLKLLLA